MNVIDDADDWLGDGDQPGRKQEQQQPKRKPGRPRKVRSAPTPPADAVPVAGPASGRAVGRKKSVFQTLGKYARPTKSAAVTSPDTPLSPRELKLLRLLVDRDGEITHTQAAVLAGFPKSVASAEVARLLDIERSPHFVRALRSEQAGLEQMYAATRHRHLRDLQRLRDQAVEAGAWAAAVSAEVKRGQASEEGIYVARSEVRTGSLDSMSREDVMRELERIRNEYALEVPSSTLQDEAVDGEVLNVASEAVGARQGGDGVEVLPSDGVGGGASPGASQEVEEGDAGEDAGEQPTGWLE